MGWSDKSHEPSSTGGLHTNYPWFTQILQIQGNGKEGTRFEQGRHHKRDQVKETRIEHGRYRKGAQITEDRHKGWSNTGMIPNETPKVERYEDFLPFHD